MAVDCNDTAFGGGHPNLSEVTGDGVDQNRNGADASQQRLSRAPIRQGPLAIPKHLCECRLTPDVA